MGYVATLRTCGPRLNLPLTLKRWGPPRGQGCVATLAICGPLLIMPPALKRCGPPRRQGLCRHVARFMGQSGPSLGHPAQITAESTLSWSSRATHTPGATSWFPTFLPRITASEGAGFSAAEWSPA